MTDQTSFDVATLSDAIMGAARLHTHDHQMALKITQDALATLGEQARLSPVSGLADELERKLDAFLSAKHYRNEKIVAEVALRNALWDNKAGIVAALARPDHAQSPGWQPIEAAPESVQQFAKDCVNDPGRSGYIEFGGTIEDGRPFVLCRNNDGWQRFDRWLILPSVDSASPDLTNHHNALKCPYCNPDDAVRKAVIEECTKIAEAEFEAHLKIIEVATNDKALSDGGRRDIHQRNDGAALAAQRIASRIRALAQSPDTSALHTTTPTPDLDAERITRAVLDTIAAGGDNLKIYEAVRDALSRPNDSGGTEQP